MSHALQSYGPLLVVSLLVLLGVGVLYPAALPTMLAVSMVTALVVAPWAAWLGFRYGARRGVESAIETMAGSEEVLYRELITRSRGEPSADR